MGDYLYSDDHSLPSAYILKGHYTIQKVIGRGGFGITYAAFDSSLCISVAVKELFLRKICRRERDGCVSAPPEYREQYDESRKNFLQEARVLAELDGRENPGIVRVRECFEENNTVYIVMELLTGLTLREYVKQKGGALSGQQTCMLLHDAAMAVCAMHDRELIHKDISPDNIMVTPGGEARLLDFGCATRLSNAGKPAQLFYRRGYAAPEQYSFEGRPDRSTDVYGMAATVYYCLTGHTPPDAPEREKGRRLPAPRDLGAGAGSVTDRIVLKAMDLRQNRRYADMREFWTELRMSVFSQKAARESVAEQKRKAKRRRVIAASAVAAGFVLAAGLCLLPPSGLGRVSISGAEAAGVAGDEAAGAVTGTEISGEEAGTLMSSDTAAQEAGSIPEQEVLHIVLPEDGLYRIRSCGGEGKILHVMNDSEAEGTLFDLTWEEVPSTVYFIRNQGSGYTIRRVSEAENTGYLLSILDDSPESGAFLCQRREDGSDRQYFTFFEDVRQNIYVRSAAGTWLDAEKERMRLTDFSGSLFQMWRLEKVSETR